MFFYEDFIKKLDSSVVGQGVEKFTLDAKKTVVWLGTGIPFFIAGILELYISYTKNFAMTDLVIGIIFFLLSARHLKMYFSYKIILDFNEKKLKSKDVTFEFDNIVSCILKEQVIGKKRRMDVVLDVITKDGQEIIIPLMMNKKLRFASLMKNILGKRFSIQK